MLAAPLTAQSHPVPLTRHIELWNPQWSPDGRTIVFEANLHGEMAIYTIGADGTGLRRLTVEGSSGQPSWSPDGRRIVYSSERGGSSNLWLMNADGSGQAQLTSMTGGGGYYQSFFSRDGRLVVFQGRPDWALTRDRVYVIGADGNGFRQLSDTTYGAEGPRWLPDGRVSFQMVPYPRPRWDELAEGELDAAKKATRLVAIRPDGTGLGPATEPARPAVAGVPEDAERSPDGKLHAYAKAVDGWNGVYVYDVAAKKEQLVAGGRGAGPVGYLRTATMSPVNDTIDTYVGPRGGAPQKSAANLFRSIRQVCNGCWELSDTWYDSLGAVTAKQSTRTIRGSLATEREWVRATVDSAQLLVNGDHVTGWVVPQGQSPKLFDGARVEERYAEVFVNAAIAKSRPPIGAVFLHPTSNLYGPNPLESRTDSMRVARRDTLYRGPTPIPVIVLERVGGSMFWLDETTGAEVASRGSAGPERFWWHVKRGVKVPGSSGTSR